MFLIVQLHIILILLPALNVVNIVMLAKMQILALLVLKIITYKELFAKSHVMMDTMPMLVFAPHVN